VLVIERSEHIGGSARTSSFLVDGVRHDHGAAVVPFAAASPAFRALGLRLRLVHSDIAVAHPLDAGALHRDIGASISGFGAGGASYRRLIEPLVRQFPALVESLFAPQLKLPSHPLLMARVGPLALAPVSQLARLVRSPEAAALVVGVGAHATVPPDRLITGGVAIALLAAAHAVGWPVAEGGTQQIIEALADAVRAAGGSIETGREIRSLAEVPTSPITMLDLTPRQLLAIAPNIAPSYRKWKYGPGACKVDYVLSGPMPWTADVCRRAATLHLGGTPHEIIAAERDVAAGRLPDRPYVLVAQSHVADPTRMHNGLLPLWAYCHVPNGCAVDVSAAMERQFDRFAPGWRDLVVAKRVMTAPDLEAMNPNLVGGDIPGGLMSLRQVVLGPRPGRSPYRTALDGVFVCSSSTPPGAGCHGMSGWHASGVALTHSNVA
jgi:phytoene dehydrogenase-like protein